jgi:hypothetical protein
MISLVGIGGFCSELVNKFSSYPQYEVYSIDTSDNECNTFVMPEFKNSEEYEKKCSKELKDFILDKNDEISVFVDGSEPISGIILAFLENFKKRKINVYYVRSDLELMGNIEKLQDKITFSILQEYTRSGLFKTFVAFDKINLEKILNQVSILEMNDQLTNLISSTSHYINIYSNIKPILSNNIELSDITRIQTYGLSEIGTTEVKWFFELNNIEEIVYYFAINSNTLKKEKNLLQTIKSQIKEKQKENVKILFQIYETNYQENFVYCVAKTKFIQPPSQT